MRRNCYMSDMRVLVIEDDPEVARHLCQGLEAAGHVIDHVADGTTGLHYAASQTYDVLIVDRMLPGRDGLDLIRVLRATGTKARILVLSALGEVPQRVAGLEAGADDYLTKPFAFSELQARVEALARRSEPDAVVPTLKVADLELDRLAHTATRAGQPLRLQPREFRLLECLMRHRGRVLTRTMLLEQVWDYHFDPQTNVVDVHIARLRAKVDRGFEPTLIHTVRGSGYKLDLEP